MLFAHDALLNVIEDIPKIRLSLCGKTRRQYTPYAKQRNRPTRCDKQSSKLAVNNRNDEQNQDGDDGNGNDAVRRHAIKWSAGSASWARQKGDHLNPTSTDTGRRVKKGRYAPSRHAPQGLDTAVGVRLTVQQAPTRVCNLLALSVQVTQGASANLLRLQGDTLRLA